jgi:fumarate hydratase class II
MPGKVNPTQCEAMTMVCTQVFGNNAAILSAGSQGNFELNVYKPLIAHAFLQSVRLLSGVCSSFTEHLLKGLEINRSRIADYVQRSLMLVKQLSELQDD